MVCEQLEQRDQWQPRAGDNLPVLVSYIQRLKVVIEVAVLEDWGTNTHIVGFQTQATCKFNGSGWSRYFHALFQLWGFKLKKQKQKVFSDKPL